MIAARMTQAKDAFSSTDIGTQCKRLKITRVNLNEAGIGVGICGKNRLNGKDATGRIRGGEVGFLDAFIFSRNDVAAGGHDTVRSDHEAGAAVEMPKAAIGTLIIAAHGHRAFAQSVADIGSSEFFVTWSSEREHMAFSQDLRAQSPY